MTTLIILIPLYQNVLFMLVDISVWFARMYLQPPDIVPFHVKVVRFPHLSFIVSS